MCESAPAGLAPRTDGSTEAAPTVRARLAEAVLRLRQPRWSRRPRPAAEATSHYTRRPRHRPTRRPRRRQRHRSTRRAWLRSSAASTTPTIDLRQARRRRHRTGRVGKFLDQGPRLAPAKRRRRRAGDDVRAARASFVIIAGEPNPSPPLQHVEEQLFFVRGGFFTCAASRSEFSTVVPRHRRDGCGLVRFARLDVRRGLRRTRAGARVENAPVA